MSALTSLLVLTATAAGAAMLLRVLPWPAELLALRAPRWLGGRPLAEKPLACAGCMGGWGALVAMLLWDVSAHGPRIWIALWLAGAGGAGLIYSWVFPAPFKLED